MNISETHSPLSGPGTPNGIRTRVCTLKGYRLRRLAYGDILEPSMGLEPTTACLQGKCTTIVLRRHK